MVSNVKVQYQVTRLACRPAAVNQERFRDKTSSRIRYWYHATLQALSFLISSTRRCSNPQAGYIGSSASNRPPAGLMAHIKLEGGTNRHAASIQQAASERSVGSETVPGRYTRIFRRNLVYGAPPRRHNRLADGRNAAARRPCSNFLAS